MTPELQAEILALAHKYRRIYAEYLRAHGYIIPMVEAVPDKLMAEIVNDFRHGVPSPKSMATTPGAPQEEPWKHAASDVPLRPPPGVDICDRIMDAQDARDKAALIIDAAIKSRVR